MSLGMVVGGGIGLVAAVLLPLLGVAYLSYRRGRNIPILVLLAGPLALLLGGVAIFIHSEAGPDLSPLARSAVNVAAAMGAAFFLFTILDFLIIGEFLIERGNRYIPDVVRQILIGVEVVAAGVLFLWLIMGINLVALVALPTVAAAVVGVALKDTLARFFAGIELGKVVKVGDWISTMEKEGLVTHIGMEHVTLKTREQDTISLPNDSVISAGVTNYNRPTTTHLCSVYVDAAYRTPRKSSARRWSRPRPQPRVCWPNPSLIQWSRTSANRLFNIASSFQSPITPAIRSSKAKCGPTSGMPLPDEGSRFHSRSACCIKRRRRRAIHSTRPSTVSSAA